MIPCMLFKKCFFKKCARRDVIKVTWKGYEKIVKIIKENKTKQVIETKLKNERVNTCDLAKFLRSPILKNVCDRLFPKVEKVVVGNRLWLHLEQRASSKITGSNWQNSSFEQFEEMEKYLTWCGIRNRPTCYSVAIQRFLPRSWRTNRVIGNKNFSNNGLLSTFHNKIAITNNQHYYWIQQFLIRPINH